MVKCLPEFEYFFTAFLKNKNIIFKIRRSNVTDYTALNSSAHEIINKSVLNTKNNCSGQPQLGQIKIRVFKATRSYLNQNVLVKTRFYFQVSWKKDLYAF